MINCKVENFTRARISTRGVCNLVQEAGLRVQRELPTSSTKAWQKQYRDGCIFVFFVGKVESRALNNKFRNQDTATDVISFEYEDSLNDPEHRVGEIVVCPILIKKQAKVRGVRFEDELAHALIHGTMHVFGHHHEKNEKETRWVHNQEDFILHKLGYKTAHTP